MTTSILDVGTQLVPLGSIASSQSFPPLDVQAVRLLATSAWVVHVTIPPVAQVTFVLEAATLEAGPYVELARLVWPAGQVGSRQVEMGVKGSLSHVHSGTHRYVRVTTTQTGAFSGSSWLSKPSGSPGLGADALDAVQAL